MDYQPGDQQLEKKLSADNVLLFVYIKNTYFIYVLSINLTVCNPH